MSTVHNQGRQGEIAEKILLPGDPLRAKFIAETFLSNVKEFNSVRNMLGFTGTYKGKEVSVMGTGMGIPSIGIYSYELIHTYGVKELIRIGSCGTYQEDVKINDLIFAQGACTDSNYAYQYKLNGTYSAICDFDLLRKAVAIGEDNGYSYHVGNVLTSDVFYDEDENSWKSWEKMGVLGVEMETYALYSNAARGGVKALTVLTVSDSFHTKEFLSPEEREKSLTSMIKLSLDI